MKMKKLLSLALAAALAASFTACGTPSTESAAGEGVLKIGIMQQQEHPALDNAHNGFVDGLREAGYEDGKNIKISFENAQGEQANCTTIANKLAAEKSDLILAIGTTAAQSAATVTKDIPILVTAVTDPANASLVASNEKPGGNVSGTSDLTPVKEQIDMIKQIVTTVETVGLMYCSNEPNSKLQIELAKTECDAQGLKYVEATVSSTNEIQQVAQSLVGKVQAIYVPTDNMLANGLKTVSMVTVPAKIPIIVGESGMVGAGGIATYGINYYNLGRQTAAMAVKILKGESKPADMPIEYLQDMDIAYNSQVAAEMGIALPSSITEKGTNVTPY